MDIKPRRPRPPMPPRPPQNSPSSASPAQPPSRPLEPAPRPVELSPDAVPLPIGYKAPGLKIKKDRKKIRKIILLSAAGLVVVLLLSLLGGWLWYQSQLAAVSTDKGELVKISIKSGTAPSTIGQMLEDEGVIRNKDAFSIYTRLTATQNKLQAGSYRLSPGETTPEIVKHLTEGKVDTFNIRFLPGATLAENREVLIKAGYTEAEVDAGLSGTYLNPVLFEGKPAGDLEGYIYGETYNFSTSASVEDILGRTFEQFEKVIKENDLAEKFKAKGLTMYEGIILASIIQREAIKGDEPQIAQVFLTRLSINMELGSDVTYQYIADKTGVDRDVNLDSPYNTRRYPGLPPGPISAPGLGSLLGVANPAPGDYLFFLSGDDDITYYAKTLSEHEANISAHCKVKCSIL